MHDQKRPSKPESPAPAAPRPAAVQLRGRRSPRLIALGTLLVAVGGLGAAALYSMNADHRAVVVMAADVRRGDAIERDDLAVLEVPESLAVEALGAAELPGLVGRHSLTDLPQGAVPLARHVGEDPLPTGQALIGLRLPLGKLPTADMPPGTTVRLVGLLEGTEVAADAVVASSPVLLDDGASYSLDVRVADARADEVARLSAADLVAVVVVRGA